VNIALIGARQFLATVAIAFARNDTPPSLVRPWAPPSLPGYEGELRQYHSTETERPYLPTIVDPRKTYNLADLIFSPVDRFLRTQMAFGKPMPRTMKEIKL
jgi:hypothetical protein